MSNRIGKYHGGTSPSDLDRARDAMAFCFAIMRLKDSEEFASWEIESIATIQANAVTVFWAHGLPVPWA